MPETSISPRSWKAFPIVTSDASGVLAAIPVKPFGVAKARLSSVLDARSRSRLGKAIAANTAAAAAETGAVVVVVTGDAGVTQWSTDLGYQVVDEGPSGRGLNGAARAAARFAEDRGLRWAVVHADLPLVSAKDLAAVFHAGTAAIAPSYDGGTNIITGIVTEFPFAYGPASFHRHLAAAPGLRVISRPGIAYDLDTPADLAHAIRYADDAVWLTGLLSAP